MIKQAKLWMKAAILAICVVTVLTACTSNADHAINDDGTPNTTHSTNPVPFIYVTEKKNATVQDGVLADVAPTILHIMGLEQPVEMTGQCLISE